MIKSKILLFPFAFIVGCVQPDAALTPSISPLPEGNGISKLAIASDKGGEIYWQPPFYAVTGNGARIGSVNNGQSLSIEGKYSDANSFSWSSDGSRVALALSENAQDGSIRSLVSANDPGTSLFTPLSNGSVYGIPYLSPDGRKILSIEYGSVMGNRVTISDPKLTLVDLVSGTSVPVESSRLFYFSENKIVWSPDSLRFAWLTDERNLCVYDIATSAVATQSTDAVLIAGWNENRVILLPYAPTAVYFVSSEASISCPLPLIGGTAHKAALSPDGKLLAINAFALAPTGIYIYDIPNNVIKKTIPPAYFLGWSDNQSLICRVPKDDGTQIFYKVQI